MGRGGVLTLDKIFRLKCCSRIKEKYRNASNTCQNTVHVLILQCLLYITHDKAFLQKSCMSTIGKYKLHPLPTTIKETPATCTSLVTRRMDT